LFFVCMTDLVHHMVTVGGFSLFPTGVLGVGDRGFLQTFCCCVKNPSPTTTILPNDLLAFVSGHPPEHITRYRYFPPPAPPVIPFHPPLGSRFRAPSFSPHEFMTVFFFGGACSKNFPHFRLAFPCLVLWFLRAAPRWPCQWLFHFFFLADPATLSSVLAPSALWYLKRQHPLSLVGPNPIAVFFPPPKFFHLCVSLNAIPPAFFTTPKLVEKKLPLAPGSSEFQFFFFN